ncbi:hypothetical protein [Halogeometricum luteum]|uniref:Uncharacterized protein n=1 Tax=Halogeometricum luteum TaxID=2950537 RepID=A0ABU2G6R5_9EURY|nr:hypothetical protein [Halogeometricum sp. S3BR5-2]MDS0295999.1 hypothetical protein [Halogeometricum sp. S3BR5-2]
MPSLRDRYRRLDALVRGFSRARYAAAMGLAGAVAYVVVSSFFGGVDPVVAGWMWVVGAFVTYYAEPNRQNATG